MGKTSRRSSTFSVSLPATCANLGPGFDAAALAFDLHLSVTAQPADEFSIVAKGRDPEICGKVENNLILSTYREVLQSENKAVVPLALKIDNEAPIGKGCGSSASARLAGIALADHFGKLHWSDSKIVGEASRREHHPDNAAACWMGLRWPIILENCIGQIARSSVRPLVGNIILITPRPAGWEAWLSPECLVKARHRSRGLSRKASGRCFLLCRNNRFLLKRHARSCQGNTHVPMP